MKDWIKKALTKKIRQQDNHNRNPTRPTTRLRRKIHNSNDTNPIHTRNRTHRIPRQMEQRNLLSNNRPNRHNHRHIHHTEGLAHDRTTSSIYIYLSCKLGLYVDFSIRHLHQSLLAITLHYGVLLKS